MQNVLITGAGRGLGLEFARRFAAAGAHVHATVRDLANADDLRALGDSVTIHTCDVRSHAHVEALADLLGDTPLDVLVNNAGILLNRGDIFGSIDLDVFEEVLRVNTISPIRVAQALAHNVAASEKRLIVNISSRMGSISEGGSGAYSYRTSKAALNMAMTTIARDLKAQGVTVIVVHPGWVRTDMGGSSAPRSVGKGAASIVWAAEIDADGPTGGFFRDGKPIAW